MRRLLALVVLVGLAALAFHYWKDRGARLDGPRDALASVGDKFESTKTSAAVKAALKLNRNLAPLSIDVDGRDDGVVVLKGEVPSAELRAEAERVAAAVPDVRQVVNELRVEAGAARPAEGDRTLGESLDDQALRAKVKLAFTLDRRLQGTDIEVKSYRRQVTLRGAVPTPAQKQLAVEIARRTPDVQGVVDEIAVVGAGAGLPPAAAADAAGRAAVVQRAVAANSNLGGYEIKVQDRGGRIVMTGQVRTAAEKELAGLLARDAAGTAVENALRVTGPLSQRTR